MPQTSAIHRRVIGTGDAPDAVAERGHDREEPDLQRGNITELNLVDLHVTAVAPLRRECSVCTCDTSAGHPAVHTCDLSDDLQRCGRPMCARDHAVGARGPASTSSAVGCSRVHGRRQVAPPSCMDVESGRAEQIA